MTFDTLIKTLKTGKPKPVYLLQGEEEYYIDKACHSFEDELLTETEKDFNLTIFYGKDADWREIINACRRYPMFAEKQVVILKEAQGMHSANLSKLDDYLEDLMESTIFVIAYKGGKLDGRLKLSKLIKKKGDIFESKKIYENRLPAWIKSYTLSKGHTITERACRLLAAYIGVELSVQVNELAKVFLNIPEGKEIDEKDVEKYVGISREYNVFEFQNALGSRDAAKAMKILKYFESNPKAAPWQQLLVVLYNFFSKTETLLKLSGHRESELASAIGVSPFFIKDYQSAARSYKLPGVERVLLLLHQYNQRLLGIKNGRNTSSELLKELSFKILNA